MLGGALLGGRAVRAGLDGAAEGPGPGQREDGENTAGDDRGEGEGPHQPGRRRSEDDLGQRDGEAVEADGRPLTAARGQGGRGGGTADGDDAEARSAQGGRHQDGQQVVAEALQEGGQAEEERAEGQGAGPADRAQRRPDAQLGQYGGAHQDGRDESGTELVGASGDGPGR